MEEPILISIEGNIGAGKSTVLKELEKLLDKNSTTCVQEPVKFWEQIKDTNTGETLINAFYNNPEKYGLPFQLMAYSTIHSMINYAIENTRTSIYRPMIITERSPQSSHLVFTKLLLQNDVINDLDYNIYKSLTQMQKPRKLDVCIYLKAPIEICLERIKSRDRNGEENIKLEYLKNCENAHEQWIHILRENTTTVTRIIEITKETKTKEIVNEILDLISDLTHI